MKLGVAVSLLVLSLVAGCAGRGGVSISISPSEVTLAPGATQEFTAEVKGSRDASVTWSASGGELDASGATAVFTAPAEEGTYEVTATSATDRGRWASAVVTVEDGVGGVTTEEVDDSGGTIEAAGGEAVVVPAGLLPYTATVTIESEGVDGDVPASMPLLSSPFSVASDPPVFSTDDGDIRVEVPLPEGESNEGAGIAVRYPVEYSLHGVDVGWLPLPTSFDPETRTMSTILGHVPPEGARVALVSGHALSSLRTTEPSASLLRTQQAGWSGDGFVVVEPEEGAIWREDPGPVLAALKSELERIARILDEDWGMGAPKLPRSDGQWVVYARTLCPRTGLASTLGTYRSDGTLTICYNSTLDTVPDEYVETIAHELFHAIHTRATNPFRFFFEDYPDGVACNTYHSTTEPLAVIVAQNYESQDAVVRNETLDAYGGQSLRVCSTGEANNKNYAKKSYSNQDFWVHVARDAGRDLSFINDFVSRDFHLSWPKIDEILASQYGYADGLEDAASAFARNAQFEHALELGIEEVPNCTTDPPGAYSDDTFDLRNGTWSFYRPVTLPVLSTRVIELGFTGLDVAGSEDFVDVLVDTPNDPTTVIYWSNDPDCTARSPSVGRRFAAVELAGTTVTVLSTNPSQTESSEFEVTANFVDRPADNPVEVSIDPTSVTLDPGATQAFTATVQNATDVSVIWDATCGTIDGSGATVSYTAPGAPATCTVSVALTEQPSISDEATVTVETPVGGGELHWTSTLPATGGDVFGYGLAVDASSGRGVLVGRVASGAALSDQTAAGAQDAFVAAFSATGALSWADQFGTAANDEAIDVAADGSGALVVIGSTRGALEGASAGGSDVFVRKLAANGDVVWTRQFGSSDDDYATTVAIDGSGAVYVGGFTFGDLGGPNQGSLDAFVRKYGPDGDALWTRQYGTFYGDTVEGVAVAEDGTLYAVGTTGAPGSVLGASGTGPALLRAYAASGDVLWTRQYARDAVRDVAVAPDGALVIGGLFGVMKTDASGEPSWNVDLADAGEVEIHAVATDASGAIVATGLIGDIFSGDAVTRKLTPAGGTVWTDTYGFPGADWGRDVAVDGSGDTWIGGYTGQASFEGLVRVLGP